MSCIHYKFKSSMDYDTLTFDGLHISLADLKKAIIDHKKLGKSGDFHLQITDAQTKQGNKFMKWLEYGDLPHSRRNAKVW